MGNVPSTFERIKHLHTPHYKFTKHLFLFRWISRGKKRFCINKEILSSSRSSITIVFNWQICYCFYFNHQKWYFFLKPRKSCTFWHFKLEEIFFVSNILNTSFFLFVLFYEIYILWLCESLPNASCKNILNMIQTVVL